MNLPDVNVWIATLWDGHVHHRRAKARFDRHGEYAFCRITHMGVLRLLSNPAVMGGDALPRSRAWHVLDELLLDSRVVFASEPPNLEAAWRVLSAQNDHSHRVWTDDYLAAFAWVGDLTLLTFDRAFEARYQQVNVEVVD